MKESNLLNVRNVAKNSLRNKKSHLNTHIQTAHLNITYQCDQCDVATNLKKSLLNHKKHVHEKHLQEKYNCDNCN